MDVSQNYIPEKCHLKLSLGQEMQQQKKCKKTVQYLHKDGYPYILDVFD